MNCGGLENYYSYVDQTKMSSCLKYAFYGELSGQHL